MVRIFRSLFAISVKLFGESVACADGLCRIRWVDGLGLDFFLSCGTRSDRKGEVPVGTMSLFYACKLYRGFGASERLTGDDVYVFIVALQ